MITDWESIKRKMQQDAALDDFERAVEEYEVAEAEWVYWLEAALLEQWRKSHLN